MAKVIKREDLDKKFTEAVMKYMNKGLFIATSSMSGHQGEEGKIDLTDGKSTYRVLMYKTFEHAQFQRVIIIEVRKYDEYVTRGMHTLWNDKGELIDTALKMYEVEGCDNVYVETEEEAKAIRKLQLERYKKYNDSYWRELPKFDVTKVRDAVRAQGKRGYKRVKRADIVKVERRVDKAQYRVEIAGKAAIVIG